MIHLLQPIIYNFSLVLGYRCNYYYILMNIVIFLNQVQSLHIPCFLRWFSYHYRGKFHILVIFFRPLFHSVSLLHPSYLYIFVEFLEHLILHIAWINNSACIFEIALEFWWYKRDIVWRSSMIVPSWVDLNPLKINFKSYLRASNTNFPSFKFNL